MVGKQTVYRARYEVRRLVERLDNPEVRNARRLVRALRGSVPDVIMFGESTVSFVAPYDTDRRQLWTMVDDDLGPDVSLLAIHGGSYHAELIGDYLGLIEAGAARPRVVVVALWIRGRYLPWIEHPVFGHKRAMTYLRAVRPDAPARALRGGWPHPGSAEFADYHRHRYSTLVGDRTIGEYVEPLKDRHRWRGKEDERSSLIHAYHQGARLDPAGPEMAAVTAMGERLRALGCRVVAYQTPVPVESGVGHFGEQFAELAAANFATFEQAFVAGLGREVPVVRSGTIFASSEFIDVSGADEHLNEIGRRRLAAMIADAVRKALDP